MSATSECRTIGLPSDERSSDELDELVALARMIAFAKGAAEDIDLSGAMHCLGMALNEVLREIGDGSHDGLADAIATKGSICLN